ncbi:hypothetical protein [Tropicimonas marinistellae]|uniref:hypothetical protein n=1 Tax=Tropicimonas marinistellae TaxID=1739787 RepID=UPI00082A7AE7|nr:hypothetical protein [Tropicimonas marinistellae]
MNSNGTGTRSARGIVAPMMAVISALLVLAFLLQERPEDASQLDGVGGFVTVQIAAQALGGAICGWLFASVFGQPRVFGWMLSVIGGFFLTLLSGAVAGALLSIPRALTSGLDLNELLRIVGGALTGILAYADQPVVGLGWLVLILLTHVLAARQRRSPKLL